MKKLEVCEIVAARIVLQRKVVRRSKDKEIPLLRLAALHKQFNVVRRGHAGE